MDGKPGIFALSGRALHKNMSRSQSARAAIVNCPLRALVELLSRESDLAALPRTRKRTINFHLHMLVFALQLRRAFTPHLPDGGPAIQIC